MNSAINQDGTSIHYEHFGSGDAVILIHGLGSCGQDWEYQFDELSTH